jgi:Asp/Glu/hydantoin racemase
MLTREYDMTESLDTFRVRRTDYYGAPVGVLMIDSREPFIPGDIGNASTFGFPVRYRRVVGATIDRLVLRNDPSLAQLAIEAAQDLIAEGAQAITSNCGFMLRVQQAVTDAVSVPVFLSGLLQLPMVEKCIGKRQRIGIITSTASALDQETLALTGVDVDRLVVAGMDNCSNFRAAFLDESGLIRPQLVEREVSEVAANLTRDNQIGTIVMECAALPPYAHAIQRAVGPVPLLDATTLVNLWYSGMFRKPFIGHY